MAYNLLSADVWEELPSDPIDGAFKLIEILESEYYDRTNGWSYEGIRISVGYLRTYLQEHEDCFGSIENVAQGLSPMSEFFSLEKIRIGTMLARDRIKKKKSQLESGLMVSLDEGGKVYIRDLIGKIRSAIDGLDINSHRKQDFIEKLNAFSSEIEKEFSSVERLGHLWLAATRGLARGAENLGPVVELIGKIRKVFSKAQDQAESRLAVGSERRQALPSPESIDSPIDQP